jgi:peroxiredoxin
MKKYRIYPEETLIVAYPRLVRMAAGSLLFLSKINKMNAKSRLIILLAFISLTFGCDSIQKQESFFKHRKHIKYIITNPDSLESAHRLAVLSTTFGKEKTSELFNKLNSNVKKSNYGKMIEQYLLLNKDLHIGDKFVDFDMLDSNGQPRKLEEFQGKIVLLEFWASWCAGCLNQITFLKKAYEKYHNDGFEIFAVSFDEKQEDWIRAIEQRHLNWIHVSEFKSVGNTAGFIYGVHSIPDNFLIDKNGIIIARDLSGDELNKKLNKLIKK